MYSVYSLNRWLRGRSGFTLIEMLVVIGILLILVAIAVPNFMNMVARARNTQARAVLLLLKSNVSSYHTDTRQWPESGSEHIYYILGGYSPFGAKTSKRYNPPYMDFDASTAGRDNYSAVYASDPELQVKLKNRDGSVVSTLTADDLKLDPTYYSNTAFDWTPLLDPWNRPIIYISPDDLKIKHEQGVHPNEKIDRLIAIDNELVGVLGADGNTTARQAPFGLNSGQFWSSGRDGSTANRDDANAGFFQPGNLIGFDKRDNDDDTRVDETDFKPNRDNLLAEDDSSSW